MNCPNRRSNARAESVVVTHGGVRTSACQDKHHPIVMPRIRENEPDRVVLADPALIPAHNRLSRHVRRPE